MSEYDQIAERLRKENALLRAVAKAAQLHLDNLGLPSVYRCNAELKDALAALDQTVQEPHQHDWTDVDVFGWQTCRDCGAGLPPSITETQADKVRWEYEQGLDAPEHQD